MTSQNSDLSSWDTLYMMKIMLTPKFWPSKICKSDRTLSESGLDCHIKGTWKGYKNRIGG
jgi:hypothetical protein